MNVVIYTNCQGNEIKKYLEECRYFNDNYRVIKVIMPHYYNDESLYNGGIIQREFLPADVIKSIKMADVFVHQPFSQRRGIFSTVGDNSVLKILKETCKIISFPSLYSDIFPVYMEGKYIKGAQCIKKIMDNGATPSEILELFHQGELDFRLDDRFRYSLNFMSDKEKYCSIKASDFILDNIKTHRLFDTQNHPTEILLGHITNNIFKILSIDYEIDIFKMKRYTINGFGSGLPDSSYMYKEIGLQYCRENSNNNYYCDLISKFVNSPEKYFLLDYNRNIYQ